MNREIPIVGDEYCEIGFGTGAVKMTPAHDPNDFEVGLRHNLEVIRVIADDGTINENGGKYNGMDRYECRKAIVKDLEEQGYLTISASEIVDGRARNYYAVTAAGREYLRQTLAEYDEISGAFRQLMEGWDG